MRSTIAARLLRRYCAPGNPCYESSATPEHALRILNGKKVWEVLPREIGGKWGVVERVMREMPEGAGIIYIGDDETDEEAFRVLPDQITVAVGKRSGTRARYYLPSSASVLRFLARLEKELP